MKRARIRSTIFNLLFFSVTGIMAVAYIPALLLPRKEFVRLVELWLMVVTALEYVVLGLKYEVRGRENLPKNQPFIVAAKHQSAYEAMKIHLLFKDPAIILKRELLWIPLFGWYLQKAGMIAIDRSTPEKALRSIADGALRVKNEGRPIVIFPQGTRVSPGAEIAYKPGIARIAEITGLPVIPMALNSGIFWPRNAWFKSPGRVTFQLLKPLAVSGDRHGFMSELEKKTEETTNILIEHALRLREGHRKINRVVKIAIGLLITMGLVGFYLLWWQMVAETIRTDYIASHTPGDVPPVITGFPGVMKADLAMEVISTPEGRLTIKDIHAQGIPLPYMPIFITTGEIRITDINWNTPLIFDNLNAKLTYAGGALTIKDSMLSLGDFRAGITGKIDASEKMPVIQLDIALSNYQPFLQNLAGMGIIDSRTAMFTTAAFNALANAEGVARVPVTQSGRTLYAGPFAIAELPSTADPQSEATDNPQAQAP